MVLSPVAGGEAAAGHAELFAVGFVPSLFDTVGADSLGVPTFGSAAIRLSTIRNAISFNCPSKCHSAHQNGSPAFLMKDT